jgi:hypothetical protein
MSEPPNLSKSVLHPFQGALPEKQQQQKKEERKGKGSSTLSALNHLYQQQMCQLRQDFKSEAIKIYLQEFFSLFSSLLNNLFFILIFLNINVPNFFF